MLIFLGSVQREANAVPVGWASEQARAAAGSGADVTILSPDIPDEGGDEPGDGIAYRQASERHPIAVELTDTVSALILIPDIEYALLMEAATAARSAGRRVVLILPDMPQWLDMPKLHALLGRTDLLLLRQPELERAVQLLGRDMLGDCSTTMEMVAALAYWASFGVLATDGREGAIYAEGETAPQRFLSPDGLSLADARVFNLFSGALAASQARHDMPDAIREALDTVGRHLRAEGTQATPRAADIILRS